MHPTSVQVVQPFFGENNRLHLSPIPGRGRHDQPGRPARGGHPEELVDPVQRQPDLHLHRVHPGGRQPVPDLAHLHQRADQAVQGEEDWRIAASHLRNRGQLLQPDEEN